MTVIRGRSYVTPTNSDVNDITSVTSVGSWWPKIYAAHILESQFQTLMLEYWTLIGDIEKLV